MKARFLAKSIVLHLMDLVLFSLCVAFMGVLSFLIVLTRLRIQAKRGILPLVVALVLAIIVLIIMVLLPPLPPCTNPTVCNYLMSIM